MGAPLNYILDVKGMILQNKGKQTTKKPNKLHLRNNRKILMKGRRRSNIQQRDENGIERRVKTLKKLIPNHDSQGLDGLYRDTAAYIISLQMRVRLMQFMVDLLTNSQNNE
ncbi:unnamed protein product [Amaranthus hypochondriacus]